MFEVRLVRPGNAFAAIVLSSLVYGCGEDDRLADANPFRPWGEESVTVIGGEPEAPVATGELSPEGCLQVTVDSCIPVDRSGPYCKDTTGPADAVQIDGTTALVVCYADEAQKGPVTVVDGNGDGTLDIPQQSNGAVITFDPATDGKAVPGDITIDANNVSVYGNGPDKSIIEGNLVVTGNNVRVRGIRVKGNVSVNLNTAALLFMVIEGNLEVGANNVLVAETQVFGNFTVTGNNAILAGNGAGKMWSIGGSGHQCDRNYAFSDGDTNFTVAETERGDALSCM